MHTRAGLIGWLGLAFIVLLWAHGAKAEGEAPRSRHIPSYEPFAPRIPTYGSGEELLDRRQRLFERVFGDHARLDMEMVRRVREAPHGQRHYVDRDGDGRPEEVWFIDTAPRHRDAQRPILVRAIDRDGDLRMGGEPDLDSDLYIADWQADGRVDAVVEYVDTDGDNDLDQMGIYFDGGNRGLRLWWSRDDGDDNLLWFDVDYTYSQRPCEKYSHFGGDESFIHFHLPEDSSDWIADFESPFLFWDRTGNGVTNEVLRISGFNERLHSFRWSFDADNDATPDNQRDFDVSISAWALEGMTFGEEFADRMTIQGRPTGVMLSRERALEFAGSTIWGRTLLTWDENDNNITPYSPDQEYERWEGVIMHPSTRPGLEMRNIGSPSCGPWNKRNEIVLAPTRPTRVYFNPATHRIHLKGADRGWLDVDWDYNNTYDMGYEWFDTDRPGTPNHGYLDRVTVDFDGDGKPDDSWNIDQSRIVELDYAFEAIHEVWAPVLREQPEKYFRLNMALAAALDSLEPGAGRDPVWDLLASGFDAPQIIPLLRRKWVASDETIFYYLRLAADRRSYALKLRSEERGDLWRRFDQARFLGDTDEMGRLISAEFGAGAGSPDYRSWIADLRAKPERPRVAWDDTWRPPGVGWESEKAAFVFDGGRIDAFCKKREMLIFPEFVRDPGLDHVVQEWGMDMLLVGRVGLGGMTLYVNGEPWPVRADAERPPAGFETRLLEQSNERLTLEAIARGIGPEGAYSVRLRPAALAGRADSPIEVVIEGGRPGDRVELGIGLDRMSDATLLADETAGVIAVRGWQERRLGWVGSGVIFPASRLARILETDEDYQAVLGCRPGEPITYHIRADWLRGRQYPVAPSAQDWLDELRETARLAALR